MKTCTKCNIEKSLDEFSKRKDGKYGVRSICKICKTIITKEYLNKNKENKKIYHKIWYEKNKIKVKENVKKWCEINPIRKKENYDKWVKINPEKIKKYSAKWSKENNKINPHISAWRNLLGNCLIRMDKNKKGHTIDLLGYSALELRNHMIVLFTDGMSWNNHGDWHIDHIKPVISFSKETLPSIVNVLSNLRPLWATTREINGIIYEGNLNRPKY